MANLQGKYPLLKSAMQLLMLGVQAKRALQTMQDTMSQVDVL